MMVIFLVGLVSMILMRTLRKDYARYSKEDDLDEMVGTHWSASQDHSVQLFCSYTISIIVQISEYQTD